MGWFKRNFEKIDETLRVWSNLTVIYTALFGAGGIVASLGVARFVPSPSFLKQVKPEWAVFLIKFMLLYGFLLTGAVAFLIIRLWISGQDILRYRTGELHFINLAILNAQADASLFSRLTKLLSRIEEIVSDSSWTRRQAPVLKNEIDRALGDALTIARQNVTENLNAAARMLLDYTKCRCMVAAYVVAAGQGGNSTLHRVETDEGSMKDWKATERIADGSLALDVVTGAIPYFQTDDIGTLSRPERFSENLKDCKGLLIVPICNFDVNHKFGDTVVGLLYVKSPDGMLGTDVVKNYASELTSRLAVMFYRIDVIRDLLPTEP